MNKLLLFLASCTISLSTFSYGPITKFAQIASGKDEGKIFHSQCGTIFELEKNKDISFALARQTDRNLQRHKHPFIEAYVCSKGSGEVLLDTDKHTTIKKGEVAVINEDRVHGLSSNEEVEVLVACVPPYDFNKVTYLDEIAVDSTETTDFETIIPHQTDNTIIFDTPTKGKLELLEISKGFKPSLQQSLAVISGSGYIGNNQDRDIGTFRKLEQYDTLDVEKGDGIVPIETENPFVILLYTAATQ